MRIYYPNLTQYYNVVVKLGSREETICGIIK